ncbi:Glyoxalase/bleomycin resistance protein/dioxygenase [Sphingomonas paucimobilis]|nr:Glyoxalase/bleomycin resistance protein/dioxygenase [Sphingomonas paucimobilis]
MTILGIESLVYCVDDLERCVDFFEDYGLKIYDRTSDMVRYRLPDTSNVILQRLSTHPIEGSEIVGIGVHETVWGIDCQADLDRLAARVAADRDVRRDPDGTAHFIADGGIPMALRLWPTFRMPQTSVDPVNSPGNINRLNVHRKWIERAYPKRLGHVVFFVADTDGCAQFMRDRLDFRLTDTQRGFGSYLRADGASDHHNIFFYSSNLPFASVQGKTSFCHTNFAVTDLDEIMAGTLYMQRRGWAKSEWGLGRHRISSGLFNYIPCPAGGDAEYGADVDACDDNWVPRDFDAMFGFAQWMHDIPQFWYEGHDWSVGFAPGFVHDRGETKPRPYLVAEKQLEAHPSEVPAGDEQVAAE